MSINLNARLTLGKIDRDDVEPARPIGQPMPHEVVGGHPCDALLLAPHHGRGRPAVGEVGPRLHLDEHDGAAVPCDDVDLPEPRAMTPRNNFVAAPLKLGAGKILAAVQTR